MTLNRNWKSEYFHHYPLECDSTHSLVKVCCPGEFELGRYSEVLLGYI